MTVSAKLNTVKSAAALKLVNTVSNFYGMYGMSTIVGQEHSMSAKRMMGIIIVLNNFTNNIIFIFLYTFRN